MIGRIFVGIWRGLDGLRKFLHLLLLLLLFGVVVGALNTSIPRIADRSALVIRPKGTIVEQLTGSPVDQRNPVVGSHRCAQGGEERFPHQGGRVRPQ